MRKCAIKDNQKQYECHFMSRFMKLVKGRCKI